MQRLRGIVQIAFAVSVILLSQSADAFSRERFRLAEKVADARLDDPTGRSSEMLTGGEEDHAKKPGFILLVFEFIVNKTGFGVKDHDLQQAGSLSASSSSSSSEEEHGWLFGKREKHPIRIIVSNQTKASANLDPAQVQAQKELRDAQKLFPNRDFVYLIEVGGEFLHFFV